MVQDGIEDGRPDCGFIRPRQDGLQRNPALVYFFGVCHDLESAMHPRTR